MFGYYEPPRRSVTAKFQTLGVIGCLINLQKKLISDEINSSFAAGNRFFYSPRQIFRSRVMSKAVKIKIYKMTVKPAAVFGSET
jgi:hypothetical protein